MHLEALEARDAPSVAPWDASVGAGDASPSDTARVSAADPGVSLSLSVAPGPHGTATIFGQVSAASPTGGLVVTISGVVSGSVTTNADGTFAYSGPASGLGQIQVTVTDGAGNTASAFSNLTADPPTIVQFRAINNGDNNWTFTGQVQGPNVAGLVVTLAGIPSLDDNNASATVQADGYFSYTVTLQPDESGGVVAETIDWWGQASNEATAYVTG